jgi:arylsulfatase A-like enzyme
MRTGSQNPNSNPMAKSRLFISCLLALGTATAFSSFAAGLTTTAKALPDRFNLLPALLGQTDTAKRDFLVLQSGNGQLAVRSGQWKYISDLDTADDWKAKAKTLGAPDRPGLYDLTADPGEKENVYATNPAEAARIAGQLSAVKTCPQTRP